MKKIVKPRKTQGPTTGDTVEYMGLDWKRSGVIGVITGVYDSGRVLVLCPSGHEWILRCERLDVREKSAL